MRLSICTTNQIAALKSQLLTVVTCAAFCAPFNYAQAACTLDGEFDGPSHTVVQVKKQTGIWEGNFKTLPPVPDTVTDCGTHEERVSTEYGYETRTRVLDVYESAMGRIGWKGGVNISIVGPPIAEIAESDIQKYFVETTTAAGFEIARWDPDRREYLDDYSFPPLDPAWRIESNNLPWGIPDATKIVVREGYGDGTYTGYGYAPGLVHNTYSYYGVIVVVTTTKYTKYCLAPRIRTNGICELPPDVEDPNKDPDACNGVGNPCNAATGNKYQNELDYQSAGKNPLRVERFYNSRYTDKSVFGPRWRGGYDRSIVFVSTESGKTSYLKRQNGKIFTFNLVFDRWVSDKDVLGKLSHSSVGWSYLNSENELEQYNVAGKLISIKFTDGDVHTLKYSCTLLSPQCQTLDVLGAASPPASGLLVSVTANNGRKLLFSYDQFSRVSSIRDPAGESISYIYAGSEPNSNLKSVTYQDGATREYLYGELEYTTSTSEPSTMNEHLLTGIVDENGDRYATWSYDEFGRATSSEHGTGADKVQMAYSPGLVTDVVDASNSTTRYTFALINGVKKMVSVAKYGLAGQIGTPQSYVYDNNGNVTSKTDFSGNTTKYTYDPVRNLELSRTEAFATPMERTILTTWHPELRLPASITQSGTITTFSYDPNSNLLQKRVSADGKVMSWNFTYDSYGRISTAEGPSSQGNATTVYAYDSAGNLASVTNPLAQKVEFPAYDLHGRPLKVVDLNGVVTDLEYDARQRLTRTTKEGRVTAYSYDGVGQLTKIIEPSGAQILLAYDPARRLTSITDGAGNTISFSLDNAGNRIMEETLDDGGILVRRVQRVFNELNQLVSVTGATQ